MKMKKEIARVVRVITILQPEVPPEVNEQSVQNKRTTIQVITGSFGCRPQSTKLSYPIKNVWLWWQVTKALGCKTLYFTPRSEHEQSD